MELLIVRVAGFRLGSRGLIAYGVPQGATFAWCVPQGATFYLAMTQKHVGVAWLFKWGKVCCCMNDGGGYYWRMGWLPWI